MNSFSGEVPNALFLKLNQALDPRPSPCADQTKRKKMTIIHVCNVAKQELLLGHKARGFGSGKWNGFGGKFDPAVDADEVSCACRELEEECGLHTTRDHMLPVGIIFFHYPQDLSLPILEVHVFVVDIVNCSGAVVESEEMTPIQWYPFDGLPLSKMWADDEFWLPKLVNSCCSGRKQLSSFRFSAVYIFLGFDHIVASAMLEWSETEQQ